MANKVTVSYNVGSEGLFITDSAYSKSSSNDVITKSDSTIYKDTFLQGSTANQLATPEKFGLYSDNYVFQKWYFSNTSESFSKKTISCYSTTANGKQWSTSVTVKLGTTNGGSEINSITDTLQCKRSTGSVPKSFSFSLDSIDDTTTYYLSVYRQVSSSNKEDYNLCSFTLEKGRSYTIKVTLSAVSSSTNSTAKTIRADNISVSTTDGKKSFYLEDGLKADAVDLAYNIANVDETKIKLIARWEQKTFTVKYDSNGSSGSIDDSSFKAGNSNSLTSNSFIKPRYKFIGWNTKPDGSGASFEDGASFPNNALEYGETVILYAQWERTEFSRGFYVFINGKWEYCKPYIYLEKKDLVSKDEYEILDANGLELEGDDSWENIR